MLSRRHPLRILVAEDIEINRKLLAKMLSRLGYDRSFVTMVNDGKQAADAIEAGGGQVSEEIWRRSRWQWRLEHILSQQIAAAAAVAVTGAVASRFHFIALLVVHWRCRTCLQIERQCGG